MVWVARSGPTPSRHTRACQRDTKVACAGCRYERRALEEAIQIYPEVVIATPGGLVSDSATLNEMLSHCFTIWLQATPEDHLARVAAQGDMRPMAGSGEALEDLKLNVFR